MAKRPEDPVLRSARREAIFVLVLWVAAVTYSVTYCYLNGYGRSVESLTFVLGFPDWVFYGIVVPWLACVAISYWFSHFFMTDEDLGADEDGDGLEGKEDEHA